MSSRSIPLLFLLLGLGALVAGNSGGCPADFAGWLTSVGETDDTDASARSETEKTFHEKIFTEVLGKTTYENTADSCLVCHSNHAEDLLKTAHWNWEGTVTNIAGFENTTHGKRDLINNL